MFAGHQGDYTFASSADGLTVTVTDRSTGDFDTVTNVETLSFDDGDIGVSHDGTGLVLTGPSKPDPSHHGRHQCHRHQTTASRHS